MNRNDKQEELYRLQKTLRTLRESPLYDYRQEHDYQMVFGEGDVDAKIMFIGEAPGKQEAQSGRPFVGRSGKVLDELLATINLKRDDIYITNVVKDRPPDNRDPHRDEVALYKPYLLQQINIIQPAVIATLGRFAMEFMFEEFDLDQPEAKISELHGQQLIAKGLNGETTVIPLYHPAVALYNQGKRQVLEEDFSILRQFL